MLFVGFCPIRNILNVTVLIIELTKQYTYNVFQVKFKSRFYFNCFRNYSERRNFGINILFKKKDLIA